jgi:hypothetical protein
VNKEKISMKLTEIEGSFRNISDLDVPVTRM